MMIWVRRIIMIVVSLAVLFLLVAYISPSKVHVERDIVVNAPPERVYVQVVDFRQWPNWSPWHAKEPTAQYTYSGSQSGVGAVVQWQGEVVGEGRQEIVSAEPSASINTALDFGDQGTAQSDWRFEPTDDGTRVTWGFDSEMGNNPIARIMGLMMDRWIGADYEEGLKKLKDVCESDTGSTDAESDSAEAA